MYAYQKIIIPTDVVFLRPTDPIEKSFSFSSSIEKIGIEWDVDIRNGSYVSIISDVISINHPKYGTLSLIKVKADVATDFHTIIKEFWVPTDYLHMRSNDQRS